MASKKSNNRSRLVIVLILLVVIAGGLFYYFDKVYHHDKNMAPTKTTTSSTKPIRAATSKPTTPQSSSAAGSNPGGATDENGQTPSSLPPSSDWVSSSSGDITLQLPSEDTTVSSGDTITGTAKVSSVNYILSDTSVGVIDQGSLSVVNGRFTGKMNFTAHSSTGTLQVFYANPSNGAEEDVVEINVSL